MRYIALHKVIIMKNEMLSARIDHDTKVAFTNICDEVGLSTSQAIKLFAKAVINHVCMSKTVSYSNSVNSLSLH